MQQRLWCNKLWCNRRRQFRQNGSCVSMICKMMSWITYLTTTPWACSQFVVSCTGREPPRHTVSAPQIYCPETRLMSANSPNRILQRWAWCSWKTGWIMLYHNYHIYTITTLWHRYHIHLRITIYHREQAGLNILFVKFSRYLTLLALSAFNKHPN